MIAPRPGDRWAGSVPGAGGEVHPDSVLLDVPTHVVHTARGEFDDVERIDDRVREVLGDRVLVPVERTRPPFAARIRGS